MGVEDPLRRQLNNFDISAEYTMTSKFDQKAFSKSFDAFLPKKDRIFSSSFLQRISQNFVKTITFADLQRISSFSQKI